MDKPAAMVDTLIDEKHIRASFERAMSQPRLSSDYVQQWMGKIRFDGLSASGNIILGVQNMFIRDFVDEHFVQDILVILENDLGTKVKVEWHIDPNFKGKTSKPEPSAIGSHSDQNSLGLPNGADGQGNGENGFFPQDIITPPPKPLNTNSLHPVPFRKIFNKLDRRYSFDTFVSAPSNELAFAGARALSQSIGDAYNPLFIYGGSGLGKTHLLNAIGNRFLELNPGAKVIYMSSDELTNDYIGSFTNNQMPEFRKRMREDCDCLLIDDIQFLGKREQTQEEFFNIFNALYNTGKPVAMSSDRIPAEIEGIADRLRTRFISGLLADIKEPNFETRVAILKKKAEIFKIELPDSVAYYIASVVHSNVRELQMALNRVYAHHSLTCQPMTEELAAHILKNVIPEPKQLGIEDVQKEISKYYNVTIESLTSSKRKKNIVKARQMAMYIARKLTGTSYPEIGNRFHRDHSTVLTSCEKIENEIQVDEHLKQELEYLMSRLTGKK